MERASRLPNRDSGWEMDGNFWTALLGAIVYPICATKRKSVFLNPLLYSLKVDKK